VRNVLFDITWSEDYVLRQKISEDSVLRQKVE
jgi:hypothetical protein